MSCAPMSVVKASAEIMATSSSGKSTAIAAKREVTITLIGIMTERGGCYFSSVAVYFVNSRFD